MSLLAGSCLIADNGTVTGTGLAKAMADATMAAPPAGSSTNAQLQQWINLLAVAIVNHLTANAAITVTVSAGGLQTTPNPNNPSTATGAPASPVNLSGTLT